LICLKAQAPAWGTIFQRCTMTYLLGMPQLGDFLEEGLSLLGYSIEEFEEGRL
jgi:hypothetical protein